MAFSGLVLHKLLCLSTQRPKILRLISRLNAGGPTRQVVWLCAQMQDHYDSVLAAGVPPPGETDMSHFAHERGVDPVVMPSLSREISPRDVFAVLDVIRLIRRVRPDILHMHTTKAGFAGRLAALVTRPLWGVPRVCVYTFHGHSLSGHLHPLKHLVIRFLERFLARSTSRIVVISEKLFQTIHGEFRVGRAAQYRLIPNAMDLDAFLAPWPQPAHPLMGEPGPLRIGTVGRLIDLKGYDFLLDTFAKADFPARLFIAGEGEKEVTLKARATGLGLDEKVFWLGYVPDTQALYQHVDVYVLTSRTEGTPMVLLEAMTCATPVIATRVGGVPEMLGPLESETPEGVGLHTHGYSIAVDDEKALLAALKRIRENPEDARTRALAAREHVLETRTLSRLVTQMDGLYQEALSAPKSRTMDPKLAGLV